MSTSNPNARQDSFPHGSYLQSVRKEEDSKVAVEGVGMLPEGARVEGLHGRHLNTAPSHQA